MDFKESLQHLGIEDYAERIFNSNSHGELFHLYQYIEIAEIIKEPHWFRGWFEAIIKDAEIHWQRPDSIYQHIQTILFKHCELAESEKKLKNN